MDVDKQRARWKKDWETVQTEHAKAAARGLYPLAVAAAGEERRVSYREAGTFLNAAGLGYGGRRSSLPLDALAGLCATLDVPDLSSVFWSQETITLTATESPDAELPRWKTIQDKEIEEVHCHKHGTWPPAPSS
jgi:hypothetical protein